MKIRFVSLFLLLLLTSLSEAEVLHSWVEPQPDHAFQNGAVVEYPFNTYTSKSASRSESGVLRRHRQMSKPYHPDLVT